MEIFNIVEELEKERQKNKELKKELKEANESITWWNNRFKALHKENQKLKVLCNKYEEEHKTTFEIWQKDIQANKKAIERLEKEIKASPSCGRKDNAKLILINYEKLLNILKGDNK